jgi:hypothetical protein
LSPPVIKKGATAAVKVKEVTEERLLKRCSSSVNKPPPPILSSSVAAAELKSEDLGRRRRRSDHGGGDVVAVAELKPIPTPRASIQRSSPPERAVEVVFAKHNKDSAVPKQEKPILLLQVMMIIV